MATPLVSVIMPVYNGASFLAKALPSILAQTLTDFELIIVNDCSKDNSLSVLNEWAAKDSRIRVYSNERNLGIFGTLNRLVDLGRCELIKIFCQDDVMMPNCLERQVAFMQKHPELGYARCLGTQELGDVQKQKGPYRYESQLPEIIYPQASALAFFTFGNLPGNLTNLICRKNALVEAGLFDQSYPYAGDFEMWTRVAKTYAFGLQREALVYVHSHDQQGSVTLNKHNELIGQLDRIMEALFIRLPADYRRCGRYHASVTVMVAQTAHTLRRLLERKWGAWKPFAVTRRYAGAWPVCLFLYIATAGMRWGYHRSTRRLLAGVHRFNRPEPV